MFKVIVVATLALGVAQDDSKELAKAESPKMVSYAIEFDELILDANSSGLTPESGRVVATPKGPRFKLSLNCQTYLVRVLTIKYADGTRHVMRP